MRYYITPETVDAILQILRIYNYKLNNMF